MFKDINTAWYPNLIEEAAELGLIAGFDDGTFRPKDPVTREQLIYFMMRYRERDLHQATIQEIVKSLKNSIVRITNIKEGGGSSAGSGVFIDDQGTILTNKHVTDGHRELSVLVYGKHARPATFIRDSTGMTDEGADVDLAIIKTNIMGTPGVNIANELPAHGSFCVVMGNPLAFLKNSATFGIVSHNKREHYIQVDAAINPGNSGGGCFDLQGNMIGVPTLKYVGAEIDTIAYLTSAPTVRKFLGM